MLCSPLWQFCCVFLLLTTRKSLPNCSLQGRSFFRIVGKNAIISVCVFSRRCPHCRLFFHVVDLHTARNKGQPFWQRRCKNGRIRISLRILNPTANLH
jgi:hypothetical protein